MVEITNFIGINYSFYIALFGFGAYYFGRLIGDVRVERSDKAVNYIQGFFFLIFYVVIPFTLILCIDGYLVQNQELLLTFRAKLNEYLLVILFLQAFVFSCVSLNVWTNNFFVRYGLFEKYKEEFDKKLNEYSEEFSTDIKHIFKSFLGREPVEFVDITYYKIPINVFGDRKVLEVFSSVSIYSSLYIFNHHTSPLTIVISSLFTLFTLTLTAMSIGYSGAYFPPAKIFLTDGTVLEGKILKFGKYVSLIKDEKKIFINEDRISYVEESLFKEK